MIITTVLQSRVFLSFSCSGIKSVTLLIFFHHALSATRTFRAHTQEHANLPKGVYDVSIYDEDGFASLRKAQRSSDGAASSEAAAVEPLARVSVNHGGVWKGAPVQSELVAFFVAAFVFYLAHSAKSNLQDTA